MTDHPEAAGTIITGHILPRGNCSSGRPGGLPEVTPLSGASRAPHTCFRGDTGTPPNCRGRMARAPCGPSMRKAPLLPSEHVSVLPSWERRPRPRWRAGWRLPRTAASWKFPPHPAPQSKPPTRAVAIFKMSVLTPSWGPHPKTEIRARHQQRQRLRWPPGVALGPADVLLKLTRFTNK